MKVLKITTLFCLSLLFIPQVHSVSEKIPIGQWTYIQVDNSRAKWGDWNEPEWLRYFGLDFQDVNRDGYVDILSGRYFYRNPGGNLEGKWIRIDLGFNLDGMLLVDVDGDIYADVIAQALPDVYWLEADDLNGNSWKAVKIGSLPKTGHVNGQGYRVADLLPGDRKEILVQADRGIYAVEIPELPIPANWNWVMIAKSESDEGIGVGDIDGDGDIDIAIGDIEPGQKEHPRLLKWCENPGAVKPGWSCQLVGKTEEAIDRLEIADINGDGHPDIVVSEERFPGLEPDGHLWWFEAPDSPDKEWRRHLIVRQYSMNNLDIGDIDGDGDPDISTNMHKGPSLETQIWENDGKGNFSKHTVDTGKEMHLGARLIDLDSDGDLDIAGHAWDNYQFLHLWRNDAVREEFQWKHLSTETSDLPLPNGGNQQTSTCTADFDGDGAAEFLITERTNAPAIVLYDLQKGNWEKSIMDPDHLRIEAGSAYTDIDGDGDLDVVFGGDSESNQVWWWENPLPDSPIQTRWKRHLIKNGGSNKHHDQIFGDFDGDNREELVFWNQTAGQLYLAEIPANPRTADSWEFHPIYTYTMDSEMEPYVGTEGLPGWALVNEHEGLHKIDINGDGIEDLVGGGRWFEYKQGTFIPHIIDASYTFSRTVAGDFIEGGRPEVLIVVGDGLGSMVLYQWNEYEGWNGIEKGTGTWVRSILLEGVDNGHTIDVLDFNGDGHLDIFNAEMRFGDGNPDSEIRILLGDGKGHFKKLVIAEGYACHEGRIADLDGDGDYDVLSKPYTWKAPRLDLWMNVTE